MSTEQKMDVTQYLRLCSNVLFKKTFHADFSKI